MEVILAALVVVAIGTMVIFSVAVIHDIRRDNKEDKRNNTNQ